MRFFLAGYFPKRITPRDAWLEAPGVTHIWSVSDCISAGPPGWIDRWLHNDLWLFDSVALAESVVPTQERDAFKIMAYRIWDRVFDEGLEADHPLARDGLPELEPGFVSVGFDAVGRSYDSFACSPLSCNGGAKTIATNSACLFRTLDEALAGAREFSAGNWEPGPYWVVAR